MDDQAHAATIKDTKEALDKKMDKIKSALKKFDGLEASDKKKLCETMAMDFKSITQNINQMNNSVKQLKEESLEKSYGDQLTVYKSDKKKLQDEFELKQASMKNMGGLINEEDKNQKVSEMTSQQLFKKGDGLLAEDRKIIQNMEKITGDDIKLAQEINAQINAQKGKLDNTKGVLKDMDASLGRATKQLGEMMKMYATDKMIMVLIIIIVLIILGIIIASAVGGTPDGMFNAPYDIFGIKSANNTASGK